VRLAVQSRSTRQLLGRDPVDLRRHVARRTFTNDGASQLLAEIRLAAGPKIDAIKRCRRRLIIEIQLSGEQVEIFAREVAQQDLLCNAERRQLRFLNQADGVAFPQQYK